MRRHKQATYPKYGPVELRKAWVSLNLNHVQLNSEVRRLSEGADVYVRSAAADLRARGVKIRNGKSKYLIALPVIGTGAGGARHSVGEVLQALLKSLIVVAQEVDVDVALVTIEDDVYAAAQLERRKLESQGLLRFPLSRHLTAHAERLAKLASSGHLVIFMGAGISAGAGLPLWDQLLDELAEEVGLGPSIERSLDSVKAQLATPTDDEADEQQDADSTGDLPFTKGIAADGDEHAFDDSPRVSPDATPPRSAAGAPARTRSRAGSGQHFSPSLQRRMARLALEAAQRQRSEFTRMNPMDKARLVQQRLAQHGRSLGELVCSRLQLQLHALSHAHLAAMPVREVVTTNYDTGYEQACQAVGKKVDVLPHSPGKRGNKGRWILKMHGCVTQPDSIVLTRQDYVRYNERFAALGGILMSALLTRHIVFLGFSLSDDNFARLFDAVQKARPPKEQPVDEFTAMALASQRPHSVTPPPTAPGAAGQTLLTRADSESSMTTQGDARSLDSCSVGSADLPRLPPPPPGSLPALLQSAVGELPSAYHYAIRHSPLLAKVLKLHLQNEVMESTRASPRTLQATSKALGPTSQAPHLTRASSIPEEASIANNQKMGTVLAFTVNTLQRELWGDDLAFAYVHNRDFNFLQLERARLRAAAAAAASSGDSALPSRPSAAAEELGGEDVEEPAAAAAATAAGEELPLHSDEGDPCEDVSCGRGQPRQSDELQAPHADAGGEDCGPSSAAAAAAAAAAAQEEEAALDEQLFVGDVDPSIAEMARVHDVFLDYLAFLCSSVTPHLLQQRFESMLTEPELKLKRALSTFVQSVGDMSAEDMSTPAWGEVERLITGLGGQSILASARFKARQVEREAAAAAAKQQSQTKQGGK